MIIGSHVSLSAPNYLLGALQETVGYGANACMIYTGAPQNTRRIAVEKMKVEEAHLYAQQHGISMKHVIVHAPYIINLGNTLKPETFELGVDFLKQELLRVKQLGARVLVLHPGAHLKQGEQIGLDQIVRGLDLAMEGMDPSLVIALETMAGKGSEVGYEFEQIAYLLQNARHSDQLGVCMDTCHLHDAGYDLQRIDELLKEFNVIIGLERLQCMHVNDSKNIRGARKDRHANIGCGEIGFTVLSEIVHHPLLKDVVKILETPYINGRAPYKKEIEMLKNNHFEEHFIDEF